MDRRAFVKTCTLGAGLVAGGNRLVFPSESSVRWYHRVRLLNDRGQLLRAQDVLAGSQYVFHYPYSVTPCFLLNLGRAAPGQAGLKTESGELYDWPGGVGQNQSVVAYSAICAHMMAHPTPGISYISFRAPRNREEPETGVISCCAEESRYDPYAGASVLSGPAPQPLAAIMLEHDAEDDALYAIGTLGGEMFQRFFSEFEARLSLEHPGRNVRLPRSDEVLVKRLEEFSASLVQC